MNRWNSPDGYCTALGNLAKVLATIASAEWTHCTDNIIARLSKDVNIWNRDPLFILYKLESAFLAFAERIVTYRHPGLSAQTRVKPSCILPFSIQTFQYYYDNLQFTKDEEEKYNRLAMAEFTEAWLVCQQSGNIEDEPPYHTDQSTVSSVVHSDDDMQPAKKPKKETTPVKAINKNPLAPGVHSVCMYHLLYILKVPDATGKDFNECGYASNNKCNKLHLEIKDKAQVCAILADPTFNGHGYFIRNKQILDLLPAWTAAAAAWP